MKTQILTLMIGAAVFATSTVFAMDKENPGFTTPTSKRVDKVDEKPADKKALINKREA